MKQYFSASISRRRNGSDREGRGRLAKLFEDGQYVYALYGRGASGVLKIRLRDGRAEPVGDLKNFVGTGHFSDSSLSLTPDESLLLFRDAGTSDVYALDLEEP